LRRSKVTLICLGIILTCVLLFFIGHFVGFSLCYKEYQTDLEVECNTAYAIGFKDGFAKGFSVIKEKLVVPFYESKTITPKGGSNGGRRKETETD